MKSVIAVDLGGTNCRMGLFNISDDQLYFDRHKWLDTTTLKGMEHFIQEVDKEYPLDQANALVIAIAGPVENNTRGKLSNGTLELDFAERANGSELRVSLINDFMAQAWAVTGPAGEMARHLAGPSSPLPYTRAVIGAGTGLGQTNIALDENGEWRPIPSENAHNCFPFISDEEVDFHRWARAHKDVPYISGDELINGAGLAMIHEYLTGNALHPKEVGERFLREDTDTSRWYSRFYARACKNWIMSTLCRGGLWIAGGIAAKNPYVVTNDYFMEELYNGRQWTEYLKSVPLFLIEDHNSGLWGAARYGQILLERQQA
ncbi:MAG: hypothetical protein HDQ93_06065 [Desulfovibrio sp.]|nr:hypothetical protein [Desulfovibrio sp.]